MLGIAEEPTRLLRERRQGPSSGRNQNLSAARLSESLARKSQTSPKWTKPRSLPRPTCTNCWMFQFHSLKLSMDSN